MKKVIGLILTLCASISSAQIVINAGSGGGGAATGGITSGAAATGCTINSLVYIDASGNLACAGAAIGSGTTIFDNGAAAVSPLIVKDNNVAVVTVADGGVTTFTQQIVPNAGAMCNTADTVNCIFGNSNSSDAIRFTNANQIRMLPNTSNGSYWEIALGTVNGAVNQISTSLSSATQLGFGTAKLSNSRLALTAATMTLADTGVYGQAITSCAWTNAMVVALGAVLTGDITCATLPAKTRVDKALLVIDTAAAGPTTLTVSCGDANGGTPFINYIVPSDAKAAANTVYGDAAAGTETGTSLFDATAKWLPNYVPSYTATTLVTCHFIATVANLSTVTTSTGHLILTTTLLP